MESDTPRSQVRREVREKRLAYYESIGQPLSSKSTSTHRSGTSNGATSHTSTRFQTHGHLPKSTSNFHSPTSTKKLEGHSGDNEELEIPNRILDLKLNCLEEAEPPDSYRDIDTSRTSDILMETARDFREVLKEREILHSKNSAQKSKLVQPTNSSSMAATQDPDLSTRSVSEVLKVLGERATHRRRELPRLSDLSDSEDENSLLSPTDKTEAIENESKRKASAEEWMERMRQLSKTSEEDLVADGQISCEGQVHINEVGTSLWNAHTKLKTDCRSGMYDSPFAYDGKRLVADRSQENLAGSRGVADVRLNQQEIELEKQHNSILQKILAQSNYSEDLFAAKASLSNSATEAVNNVGCIDANPLSSITPKSMPRNTKVAFSANEIFSQAEVISSKRSSIVNGNVPTTNGTTLPAPQVCPRPQSPTRRSVHFDCPPTPYNAGGQNREPISHMSSSTDARSSSSVVSLMSIKDVADRLEQLGINPHLLGVELTSGQNYQPDDRPTRWKNKGRRLVKICPECGKCNSDTVSWCLNCSCVLIGIEPQPLPKRRHRSSKNKASTALSTSYDSSKESTKSSIELDNSNSGSMMEHVYDIDSEGNQEVKVQCSPISDKDKTHDQTLSQCEDSVQHRLEAVTPFRISLPSSVLDDDVSSVGSPLLSTERCETAGSASVWDPKRMDIAQLVQQSRALLDESETKKVGAPSSPARCATPSAKSHTHSVPFNNRPVQASADSTFSSISLATPSPNRPNVPSRMLDDLRLDLISSSLEDALPTKSVHVADIAVLDRQDVLALRETSAASIKPESVPQLPIPTSPTSTVNGNQTACSSDDLKVDEILWRDPNYAPSSKQEESNTQASHLHCKSSQHGPKGRRETRRRQTNSASAVPDARPNGSRAEVDRRRPLSSQQPSYRRRWKNSSTAWSNCHPSQLKKKPAEYVVQESLRASRSVDPRRPGGVYFMQKNGAVLKQRNTNSVDDSSADVKNVSVQSTTNHDNQDIEIAALSDNESLPRQSPPREGPDDNEEHAAFSMPLTNIEDVEPMGLHGNTLEMLQQHGWRMKGDSPWLYLADEVWLRIFSFLSPKDLSSCAATCQRLHRVANDSSLWRWPVVKRKHEISEDELFTIGARRPISLKLKQCKGPNITLQGLRTFFNFCGASLRKLCFSGCNHGAFSEDQFILLAALFCPQLTSVDISFAHGVRDSTLRALAEGCDRLECVRLNGAQHVTDSGVKLLAKMHGESLRKLELYCCFAVSSDAVRELSKHCVKLTHVSFGSCNRISSNALIHFASHRRENLLQLDLRGLHSILDSTITAIVAVCPNLESLTLSNCGSVSNLSIRAVANHCSRLRKLDVCGCNQVGSDSAQELVRKCKHLEELDFSSTCVDHKTVTCLAHTWTPKLKCLRLNFCCNLKEDGLFKLCSNSKSLSVLYLYGIRNFGVAFFNRLRKEYPRIEVKSDDSLEGHES